MDILKPLRWLGDSPKAVQRFPPAARRMAGFELQGVQHGLHPSDFKPMPSIGAGVEELRVWVESGTYRIIYLARLEEAVYVLHAFPKKSQQTSPRDLELARSRYEQLVQQRKRKNPS
ncbi:Phage-related protein [Bryocella elongata]|uniref:Phage-related protein n=1 Tax=Bryocella elongata TaxID=863522 RepID=A0A1H5XPS5_9BACT|nr:type II toxin-antitoxin system RelE/ParE family toxin [Bryocella elongata]SEG13437.1 Phage-related protein [Bryocella elongata]